MRYEKTPPQPPWDCTCGASFTEFAHLDRHLRAFRRYTLRLRIVNVHNKVRTVTRSQAASKGEVTKKVRRLNFMDGG